MPKPRASDIAGVEMKWRALRLLWPYVLEHRYRALLALASLAVAKLATFSLPFLLKHIVDDLNGPRDGTLAVSVVSIPLLLIVVYGVARFMNVMFNEMRDTMFGRVTERTLSRISLQIFQHLHGLDLDFHLNRRTGGLSRDIERGTSGVSFLLRFMIFNILPTLFELALVISYFLARYGAEYAGVIFAALVVYIWFSVVVTERRTGYVREMNRADSATNNRAVDSLLNYETVKYFTNEQYEAGLYYDELLNWEKARRNSRMSLFFLNGGQALIVAASMTVMLWLAARGVATRTMTMGDFVLVNTFMLQLFIPLNFLGFVYREIKGALANIEQMFTLLDEKPAVTEKPDAAVLNDPLPSVQFSHIDFCYSPDRPILSDVSFTIAPGEKVAVVGSSGSGKSTLVKLLFRFYDCQQGSVRVGGHDVRDLQLQSLRRAIGIVPQDTVLFNDTIYRNIRYGRPDATDAEVATAIRMAQLEKFIAQLPQGSDTLVGERGLKLSGGEKQRVAIARTILKRPSILVFDEATSALDSKTERGILDALRVVAHGHTSLVIAHRLSTIVDADRILVLDHGRIVESGTHQELLAAEGIYYHMWQIQQEERNKLEVTP